MPIPIAKARTLSCIFQLVIVDALTIPRMHDSKRTDMPEHIDADVSSLRDSTGDEETRILLGVSGDRDALITQVENVGGIVEGKLGQATLRVTAPESAIDDICELEGLKSIELDREDVRRMGNTNFNLR